MSEASLKAGNIADLAAKAKSKQARRISGPLFAAIWDSLEVLYYGGTLAEVSMRASGTLYGTWKGGVVVNISIPPICFFCLSCHLLSVYKLVFYNYFRIQDWFQKCVVTNPDVGFSVAFLLMRFLTCDLTG